MNFKSVIKILILLLVLTISIGVISAADNNVTELEAPSNNLDKSVLKDYDWDDDDDDRYDWDDDYGYHKKITPKVSKGKIKTEVDADPITVKHKKNSYFKIKVENRYDDDIPVGKVKLKVKVGSGSKAKTFNVKTNSYGVAKINTKSLKKGTHKVVITSADNRYSIYKKSKITVAKQYTATIKETSQKTLKNKATVGIRKIYDDDDVEYKVFVKKGKKTKITKAVFYFKNQYTGQVIVKTDRGEYDDGIWENPSEDCSYRYTLIKVKVHYMT